MFARIADLRSKLILVPLFTLPLCASAATTDVDYNRDIRPIFSENCYACHGPDQNKRKAGLRLDRKEDALAQLKSGDFAIVPRDLAASKLIERITTKDDDDRMPPLKTGKHLTPAQIDLLCRWIAQGAEWKGHWAYLKPERPPLPAIKNKRWARNAIDAFILARLEKQGLSPSREADRVTLIRRLSFDLTGLPPTLEQVEAFVNDRSPRAYEVLVDRLLASSAFGERMALFWLDLARYADTNGYHIDNHRDMWKWREWVINSFNDNLPFDQFTLEQLAGDLLPNPTLDQKVASGFNRNCMVNFEGGADPDEYATKYIVDRISTTANVWLGTTFGCAECHDHKYDPFTQKEFYQFYAFFNNVPEKGLDGSKSNPVPSIKVPTAADQARLDDLNRAITDLEAKMKARLEEQNTNLDIAQVAWEQNLTRAVRDDWTLSDASEPGSANGATLQMLPDHSILAGGKNPDTDIYTVTLKTDAREITALRLEALTDDSLPAKSAARGDNGNFVLTGFEVEAERAPTAQPDPEPEPAVFSPWRMLGPFVAQDNNSSFHRRFIEEPKVELDKTYAGGTLRWTEKPEWKDGEIINLTGDLAATYLYRTVAVSSPRLMTILLGSDDGIQVWLNGQKVFANEVSRAAAPDQDRLVVQLQKGENKLLMKVNNTGGGYAFYFKPLKEVPAQFPILFAAAVADYNQKDFNISGAIDMNPKSGWAVDGFAETNRVNRQAIFVARQPFGFTAGTILHVRLKFESDFKQHIIGKFRLSHSTAPALIELAEIPANIQSMPFEPGKRSAKKQAEVTKYYRGRFVPEILELDRQIAGRREELQKLDDSIPQSMVMEEMEKPRDTFLLVRGNFQNKGEQVTADVPKVLPPLPAGAPTNRLALARWLVSADQPLTSRVTANRLWQMLFGTGLVKTSNDFGSQGEWPSHPELLDWLACELRDGPATAGPRKAGAWDIKHMLKLMVMSATYQQAAMITPQMREKDPYNRLLTRGPRFRMDAEFIRDNALAVSGLLNRKLGGESVRPYQPPGLWEAVAFGGEFSSQTYVQSHGDDLYRRGIYVYWKRSLPYPSLNTFDAPNREICTAQRPRTTTPLQALVLMNDPAFLEAARGLAQRVLKEGGDRLDQKLTYAFRLTLSREPRKNELQLLERIYSQQLENFRNDKKAATELISIGESPRPPEIDPSELAAWTAIGNILLNLDETITKG